MSEIVPAPQRHARGLMVVVVLGMVFLTLLALLVFGVGRHRGAEDAVAKLETLTVLPQRIRIRTEPNAKAPVVVSANAGETLTMLEDRGSWVRVQNSDGLSGWAERNNLERTTERERRLAIFANIRKLPPLGGVARQRSALYGGPGMFYPIVGELTTGTEVKVFTRDHDFYAIDHLGQVAYADVDAIDVTASGTPQLEVGLNAVSPANPAEHTSTATNAEAPPLASMPESPSAAMPADEEPAASERVAPAVPSASTGVYAAVPPGGTQPEEVDRVMPRYPQMARNAGAAGAVVIRGIVRRDGTIDNVTVIKDLPYGLGDAARDAVEQWRFRPATVNGEPIDVYYTVTVNFRLR